FVDGDASVRADALETGNGGRIAVVANSIRVAGTLSARGGATGGNGGAVETSGQRVVVKSTPDVTAPHGRGGTWLIHPADITITAAGASETDTRPFTDTPAGTA